MRNASKYGAERCEIDHKGKVIKCASRAEARRFGELILLERAKQISGLRFHPRFQLVAWSPRGVLCQRTIAHYVADAQYAEDGDHIVEEIKGFETEAWKLKRKLFEANYPLATLRIVKAGKGRAR